MAKNSIKKGPGNGSKVEQLKERGLPSYFRFSALFS